MPLYLKFDKAKDVKFRLEERLRATKERFLDFPKNKHGVTPDVVRFGHDYRYATRDYEHARKALEKFTEAFEKEFKDDIRKENVK